MRASFNRRTATKVKDGEVQRKNRHHPSALHGYVLDRESPAKGFRHVVTKRNVHDFVEIIPDWQRFSQRLERIVLSSHPFWDGMHEFYHREETGAIFLFAWFDDLWMELGIGYFDAHEKIFSRLGVSYDRRAEVVRCRFTEVQARAFVLLHVFMHELGHHYDQINQKHRKPRRGLRRAICQYSV